MENAKIPGRGILPCIILPAYPAYRGAKIVGEFYEALYRDDFQMYLQPKFILRDRSVYGAEALARWKRPDGKILPPGMFIDSLEK